MKNNVPERIDRANILNNTLAIEQAKQIMSLPGYSWNNDLIFTKENVATLFDVDVRTIERIVEANKDELEENGYQVLTGDKLQEFINIFDTDKNVGIKTRRLGIYSFRAVLNIAMLLPTSEKARKIRSQLLDIAIGIVTEKTGGHNLYINQRDPQFLESAYTNEIQRKRFTTALNQHVNMGVYKYEYFTNQIYKGIFLENSKEYQRILQLNSKANLRDTMYREVLQNIAAVEAGLAQNIEDKAKKYNRQLEKEEVDILITELINHASMQIFIQEARTKMASRDLAFRDAYHENLEHYLTSVDSEDFNRFLGEKSKSLAQQIDDHIEIFKRLKNK